MQLIRTVAVIGLLASLAGEARANDTVISLVPMSVDGGFAGAEEECLAKDISGMSCVPLQDGTRNCLVINAENKGAQFATIRADRMAVGKFIPLIGDAPDSNTFGNPPDEKCKKVDDFDNL